MGHETAYSGYRQYVGKCDPEDSGSTILCNIGAFIVNYTASHPRRQLCTWSYLHVAYICLVILVTQNIRFKMCPEMLERNRKILEEWYLFANGNLIQ